MSFQCQATCSLLATQVFLQTSASLFCQVLSKSICSFVYSSSSYSHSKIKLLLFCSAFRERKSCCDSVSAISQMPVNRTNCPTYLSFSPPCQFSRSSNSLSLIRVIFQILSVIQQPQFELSFLFPSTVSNSHLLKESQAGHFHC